MLKRIRDNGSHRVSRINEETLVFLLTVSFSFRSVTIPQRDDPSFASLTKRCESCKPMGMFKSSESEFLLCYDGTSNSYSMIILALTTITI